MKKLFISLNVLIAMVAVTFGQVGSNIQIPAKDIYQLRPIRTIENEKFPSSFAALKRFLDDSNLDEPILFKGGGLHWPIMRLTPNFLRQYYGEQIVTDIFIDDDTVDLSMSEHLDNLKSPYSAHEYLQCDTWGTTFREMPYDKSEMCLNYSLPKYPRCDFLLINRKIHEESGFPLDDKTGQESSKTLFIGKGTDTIFHTHSEFIFSQIYGQKSFYLINPKSCRVGTYYCETTVGENGKEEDQCDDENAFICLSLTDYDRTEDSLNSLGLEFENVDIRKVTLERGDVLYCPQDWWHRVTTNEDSINISLSQFFDFTNRN